MSFVHLSQPLLTCYRFTRNSLQVVPSDALSLLTADELMSIWGSAEIDDVQLQPWFDCWQVAREAEPQAELLRVWLRDQTPKRLLRCLSFTPAGRSSQCHPRRTLLAGSTAQPQ